MIFNTSIMCDTYTSHASTKVKEFELDIRESNKVSTLF